VNSIVSTPQNAVIERRQAAHRALQPQRSLAVVQLEGRPERVLTVVAADAGNDLRVDPSRCMAVPAGLGSEQALELPALAWSLWAWDQLDLELGELAIYCPGSPFDHLIGAAALMYGALPVIQIGTADFEPAPGVQVVSSTDSGVLIGELRERSKKSAGVAALDLSGKAEITDVLFEGLPRASRLMLAAYRGTPLNIDFYNNVHRKGVLLRNAVCDPLAWFEPTALVKHDDYLLRAGRLLQQRPELFSAPPRGAM
jgi:hypothetical protein